MQAQYRALQERDVTLFPESQEAINSFDRFTGQQYQRPKFLACLWRLGYYLLFYCILIATSFGYSCSLMYFEIDRQRPKITGPGSVHGFNPGLSILPRPNLYTSLIRLTSRSIENYEGYTAEFLAFLEPYQRAGDRVELSQCARGNRTYEFDPERPCAFDLNVGWPCNVDSVFGYDGESPCIVLKMNRLYGWLPDPVEGATGVVVRCEGVTHDDHANLGEISYYDLESYYRSATAEVGVTNTGGGGVWADARYEGKRDNGTFHADFFPYVNQRWYLQPLVWVVFREMKRDSLTRVQCYLIAKNINVDLERGEGSIRFEILVE